MASKLLFVKRFSYWAKAVSTASSSSSTFLSPASLYVSNGLYLGARSLHPTAAFINTGWSELSHYNSRIGRRNITLLALNDLSDNKGSRKKKTRKGRGIGSGKGKTAGRGHKGQRARSGVKLGFEGGQTPLRRRLPKRGFKNPFTLHFQPMSLKKLAKYINAGRIDSSELITMKSLRDSGALGKKVEDGVRLLGRGAEEIRWPIHVEVSRVTQRAKEAIESAGGSVRRVHYNRLGLRALLKPEWFEKKGRLLPRPARPPPKLRHKVDSIGRLPAPTTPIPFTSENITEASS